MLASFRLLLPLLDLEDHILAGQLDLGAQLFGPLLPLFLLGEHLSRRQLSTFIYHFAVDLSQNALYGVALGWCF